MPRQFVNFTIDNRIDTLTLSNFGHLAPFVNRKSYLL